MKLICAIWLSILVSTSFAQSIPLNKSQETVKRFPAFVILKPVRLIKRIPITGGSFYLGAKADVTTPVHFAGGFLTVAFGKLIHVNLFKFNIGFALGTEIGDASNSQQGFDLLDASMTILGGVLAHKLL